MWKQPTIEDPEQRFQRTFCDVIDTQLTLLKHRVGNLEEMPLEERQTFQTFCDSLYLTLHAFITGETDPKALEGFSGRFPQKGAADNDSRAGAGGTIKP